MEDRTFPRQSKPFACRKRHLHFILREDNERSKRNLSESQEYVHRMWLAPSEHKMLPSTVVQRVLLLPLQGKRAELLESTVTIHLICNTEQIEDQEISNC